MWTSSRIRLYDARGPALPDNDDVTDERPGEFHLLPQDARPVRAMTDQRDSAPALSASNVARGIAELAESRVGENHDIG
jgi:hypothetical protein